MPRLTIMPSKRMKMRGAWTRPKTTMMSGNTVQTSNINQNNFGPIPLMYSSFARHSNINFSVPYSSFQKNHLTPINFFPVTFLVNQKSMTTKIAMSQLITSSLKMAEKSPLRTKSPMTITFRTAWMMNPKAGLGGSMSSGYSYSNQCSNFLYSSRSLASAISPQENIINKSIKSSIHHLYFLAFSSHQFFLTLKHLFSHIFSAKFLTISQALQYKLLYRLAWLSNMQKNQLRIRKEFQEFAKASEKATVRVCLLGNNIRHWVGYIEGPEDTPYAGGVFQIDIQLPAEYPYKPPKMKFQTKIWHPNISSVTGAICLDILKDEWSPALTIRTALLSLQALLCVPEPNDPQDAVVAKEYKENRKQFNDHAKEWVNKYASPQVNKGKVNRLMEMGFSEEVATNALLSTGYDEEKALEKLLGA